MRESGRRGVLIRLTRKRSISPTARLSAKASMKLSLTVLLDIVTLLRTPIRFALGLGFTFRTIYRLKHLRSAISEVAFVTTRPGCWNLQNCSRSFHAGMVEFFGVGCIRLWYQSGNWLKTTLATRLGF